MWTVSASVAQLITEDNYVTVTQGANTGTLNGALTSTWTMTVSNVGIDELQGAFVTQSGGV